MRSGVGRQPSTAAPPAPPPHALLMCRLRAKPLTTGGTRAQGTRRGRRRSGLHRHIPRTVMRPVGVQVRDDMDGGRSGERDRDGVGVPGSGRSVRTQSKPRGRPIQHVPFVGSHNLHLSTLKSIGCFSTCLLSGHFCFLFFFLSHLLSSSIFKTR